MKEKLTRMRLENVLKFMPKKNVCGVMTSERWEKFCDQLIRRSKRAQLLNVKVQIQSFSVPNRYNRNIELGRGRTLEELLPGTLITTLNNTGRILVIILIFFNFFSFFTVANNDFDKDIVCSNHIEKKIELIWNFGKLIFLSQAQSCGFHAFRIDHSNTEFGHIYGWKK